MQTLNLLEQSAVSGGDNDGDEGEAEARANMDGTNIRRSFLEAFCGQLGTVIAETVGRANAALGATVGLALGAGVTECCNHASLDSCFGKPTPPPPDYTSGGGGASGGWGQ